MQLSGTNKKTLIAIIIILVAVLCATVTILTVVLFKGYYRFSNLSQAVTTQATLETSNTPQQPTQSLSGQMVPSEEPATPAPVATLDPKTSAMLDKIENQVSQVRELSMDEAIPRHVYSPEELRDYVNEEMLKEFDEMDSKKDLRRLALLGLFPREMDLRKLYEDLYSEQIAGFYKIEEREMVVVGGEKLGISERLTYAHEYVHALQYANYDFENDLDYNDDSCEEDSERCLAIKALIEGDATISQFKWFETFATQKDVREFLAELDEQESPVFESAPAYLSASMMFPYDQGAAFAEYLYELGGYAAINTAFTTQPPLSSEQIMFPERYPDDLPVKVDLPDFAQSLGESWKINDKGTVGAWDIFMMLTKGLEPGYRIGEDTATTAVEGWGGDAYAFLDNETSDEYLFVMKTVWDTDEDSEQAYTAMAAMLRQRFGKVSDEGIFGQDESFARLFRTDSNGFVLIIAETLESLNTTFEAFNRLP